MSEIESKATIFLTAGGTGGHMFPAEALAKDLISRGFNVELITDARGNRYAKNFEDIPVHVISAATLTRGIIGKLKAILAMALGYFQAAKLLKKKNPSIVVGFGGYPSVPTVYAAQRRNIPTVIHEQNAILGKANAFLAPKADRIALSLPKVEGLAEIDKVRSVTTGNPVRSEFSSLYSKPYPVISDKSKIRIFITGGSQGAGIFSETLPKAIEKLEPSYRSRLEIIQQCREEDIVKTKTAYETMGIKYRLETFFVDVAEQLALCHLVIARSGAGTVAEVTTAGRPAIYVPYPHHPDQQQKINAEAVASSGGAWVMLENNFTPELLKNSLENFLQNPEKLFRAAEAARTCGNPDAARKLGNLVMAIASGWDKEASKQIDPTQGYDTEE